MTSSWRTDSFTKHGADRLARTIKACWAERGMIVNPIVERIGESLRDAETDRVMSLAWHVRSDMVDGLPPILLPQKKVLA